ncbi:MAG: DUF1232 domain-containing protein [Chloroflexi bacterium]|nr:DUF1232 domain-containing protein [Chloroflexota bacterium]
MSMPKDPTLRQRAGILAEIARQLRLIWRLLNDARVPTWTKLLVPATLLYILSPIDFIPDVALGLGQLDDLTILLLGLWLFVDLCPKDIVRQHLEELGARIGYRIIDEEPQPVETPPPALPSPPPPPENKPQ